MTRPRHAAPRTSLFGSPPRLFAVAVPVCFVAGALGALAAMAVTGR